MPQAPEELRSKMAQWFGDIDCHGPLQFLKSHGYEERRNGLLWPPTPAHTMSNDERICVHFLIMEWDFDYVYPGQQSDPSD